MWDPWSGVPCVDDVDAASSPLRAQGIPGHKGTRGIRRCGVSSLSNNRPKMIRQSGSWTWLNAWPRVPIDWVCHSWAMITGCRDMAGLTTGGKITHSLAVSGSSQR